MEITFQVFQNSIPRNGFVSFVSFLFFLFFFENQLFQLLASISNLDLFHYCHKAPSQFGETKHGSAFDTTPKVGPTRSPLFVG